MHLSCSRPDLSQANSRASIRQPECCFTCERWWPWPVCWAPSPPPLRRIRSTFSGRRTNPIRPALVADQRPYLSRRQRRPGRDWRGNRPATYLIFWGPDWANGFTTTDANGAVYTSQQLQTYVTSFLSNLGGTSWAAIQTSIATTWLPERPVVRLSGRQLCDESAQATQGSLDRRHAVPADIVTLGLAENLVDDPLAMEAIRASAHFNYDPQATYIILTPPTAVPRPAGLLRLPYQTNSVMAGQSVPVQYALIPFLNAIWPGLGQPGCG